MSTRTHFTICGSRCGTSVRISKPSGRPSNSALRVLESGNPSSTLGALTRHGEDIRSRFICPVRDTCDDLAGWPCDTAYEAIVAVKSGIIGTLTVEILDDAADIVTDVGTLGFGTAAAVAEAYGVREVLSETLVAAEGQVATTIRLAANQCLDDFVNRVVNPFISSVSSGVESSVELVCGQATVATGADD